ncbi:DMT family transporter [Achromobacter sp. Marseille-Q4962]|uniref:DMT family transporter n=1 Tax=Achromobacter sp. Marseille-Q4962 TaxID=2942202 RepID=UPI0020748527|nr:DMT family transporter [Achromobacter sp. Marseille-Q4962]
MPRPAATAPVPARYLLYPLLAALIWSVNMIVTKMAAGVIAPAAIGFYRWVLAGALLTPFALPGTWAQRRLVLACLPRLAALGALGMWLFQGLAYVAAATTTATNMGFITATVPLLTIGVGALVLRERPAWTAVAGGVVSLVGLALLIGEGDPARLMSVGANHGDLLMGGAALAYALYGVLLRRWALPVGPWQSLYVQVLFGVIFQLPAFLMAPASPLNADNLPLVLYAGVFPSLFAPFLWMQGVRHLGPNRASVFINLMPVATVAIAAVFLGERPHLFHIAGGALALAGVLLAQMGPRPARGRRSSV